MLVIKLKKGESVWIGSEIVISLNDHDRGGAELAISAPKSVPILRDNAKVQWPKKVK